MTSTMLEATQDAWAKPATMPPPPVLVDEKTAIRQRIVDLQRRSRRLSYWAGLLFVAAPSTIGAAIFTATAERWTATNVLLLLAIALGIAALVVSAQVNRRRAQWVAEEETLRVILETEAIQEVHARRRRAS